MANSRKNQYMLLEKMGQTLREPYEAIDEINKKDCKVVYQGVPGAYSYAAMINFFGKDVDNFNVPTWRECMEAVKQGNADYAVLPIENSNAGIVADVYDLLQEYDNYIIAETYVKIEHLLLGLPGTDLENVTAVYSHPQGLMQCDRFLDTHKDWQRISQANTALAAKMIFRSIIRLMLPLQARRQQSFMDLISLREELQIRKATLQDSLLLLIQESSLRTHRR